MTGPSTNTPAPVTDHSLAAPEAEAIVIWRGQRIGVHQLPERIAWTDAREERERLFRAYLEALEALNPRYEPRLAGRTIEPSPATLGVDPGALARDLERFVLHTETIYFAALRRYLALIGIEQGDGTVADLWHVSRGVSWAHWFGPRETARAVAAAGRTATDDGGLAGWRGAERMLRGGDADTPGAAAVGAAYASIVASPDWLEHELGMAADEVMPFVDFATFVRLWRLRQAIGLLNYELRLAEHPDTALARAYFSGLVGHMTGVLMPEEMYLALLDDEAWTSAREVIVELLAGHVVDALEAQHGSAWWRDPASSTLVGAVKNAATIDDALAELGYDALDWRPVLRHIRTRLIGEMSGYGGPNITTRAGTRKL